MRTTVHGVVFATLILFSSANVASADLITYNLVGVTLAGGGTLTGSFVTNGLTTASSVISWDIVASANGSFPGFEYKGADSTVYSTLPTLIQFTSNDSTKILRLALSPNLKATGAGLAAGSSYEYESATRTVTAGSIVAAVPEPSPMALAGLTGLLGGGGFWWRRRRAA